MKEKIRNNRLIITSASFVILTPLSFTISCSQKQNNNQELTLETEVGRINKLNLSLKNPEIKLDEVINIDDQNIWNYINGFEQQKGFEYQIINFEKPSLIEANDQKYQISFNIKIIKDGQSILSKKFALDFYINKLEVEFERLSLLDLELIKPKISQDELNQINSDNLLSKIKDINLNHDLFTYQVDNLNKDIKDTIRFDIIIIRKNNPNEHDVVVDKEVIYQLISDGPISNNQQILNNCKKNIKASCSLTMEERKKMTPSQAILFENRHFFSFNEDEIKALGGKTNSFRITKDKNDVTGVIMEIFIWVGNENDPDYVEDTILIKFDGFKSDIEVGNLDREPINNLPTPLGSTSYKGKLAKFLISEITTSSENNYNDLLRKTTWEDVKKNFMYQVRFALYQMFGDNFSEINYYIQNERANSSFDAVAEGIINENRDNVRYGFQYLNNASGTIKTANLKKGEKIKIKISFSTTNSFQPTLLDRGDDLGQFTYSWWWNFDNNCNRFYDESNPLFVHNLFRDNWMNQDRKINLSISINNQTTYSLSPNQYNSYNFVLKRKYYR